MREGTKMPDIGICRFNYDVICTNYNDCDGCGWNPEVAARRKEQLKLEQEQKRGKK